MEEGFNLKRKKQKINISIAKNALIRCDKLSSLQLRIYCVLNTYSNCESIYLTQSNIAYKSGGVTRQWVNKTIIALVELGLLERSNQFDINGGQISNDYILIDFEEWAEKNNIEYNKYWIPLVDKFLFSDKLTANEWRFYCVLKTFGGYDHITPSISELTKFTGISKQSIFNVKTSAEEKGILCAERRGTIFTGNLPNEYFLTDEIEWLDAHPTEESQS